jgi:protein SCO1/2
MSILKKILVLGFLVVFPILIAVFLFTQGENQYELEVFYENGVVSTNTFCQFEEGVQHTIPDFDLVNQDDLPINQDMLADKLTIVSFFFTSCPTICPTMNSEMLRVQESLSRHSDALQILSFSVDPEYDTPAVLSEYGQALGADPQFWNMATGNREAIYMLARCGFLLPVEDGGDDPYAFIHSEKFILVDKSKRIRGYYEGTSREEVDRLIQETQVLLHEYDLL